MSPRPHVDVVHVAQAGENRGRIVLRLSSAQPDAVAVAGALRVARAYQAELESIFIEDQQLIDLANYAAAHEISLSGRVRRDLSPVTLIRQLSYAARQAERRVGRLAQQAEITYRARTMRDEPMHALNRACAEAGPWNIVALADPVRAQDRAAIHRILSDMSGATGLLLVGSAARRADGPVVAVVEDVEQLPPMLRVAERLATEADTTPVVVMAPLRETDAAEQEGQCRLLLAERSDVRLVSMARTYGHTGALVDAVRRMAPGMIIARAGGTLLPLEATPPDHGTRHGQHDVQHHSQHHADRAQNPRSGFGDFVHVLECPVFIMR